uniref:(northern house mosquito) hypothetical protein n=1 Tax=Culex pipiens TaxID=7175 RepID=A0A8D8IZM3_CULPI
MAPATDYDEKFFAVRYQPRENGNYKCGICLVEFYYKHSDRTQTLLIHDPSKLFECDVCFISLTTKLRLIRHKALGYSIQVIKSDQFPAPRSTRAREKFPRDTQQGEATTDCHHPASLIRTRHRPTSVLRTVD